MKKTLLLFCILAGILMQIQAQDKWLNYTNKDDVQAMAVEGDKIWIGTTGGVLVRDLDGNILAEYTVVDGLVDNQIRSLAIDAEGNKWFGTGGGVSKFDGTTWTTYNTSNSGLAHNYIMATSIDALGSLWFGTNGFGVFKFDGTTWTTYNTSNSGLAHNYVYAISSDALGNLWFGTSGGVSKFDGTTWTGYNTSNSGIASNIIYAISSDTLGNLWFGTFGGVSKFDGTTWTTYHTSNSGLANSSVRVISSDAFGNLWFGTSGGVSKFDGSTWTTYNTSNSGIANNFVNAISSDALGNLWFGTNGGGVSKFDGTNWTTYTTSNSGIANNFVNAISSDAFGNLWFGTNGGGVSKFDGTTWADYNIWNSGLANNNVRAISSDALGNMWFGTSQGISKFDGTTWTSYTTSNSGLAYNSIKAISSDAFGNLWFGTEGGGVSKFNGTTWTTYNPWNSGLANNEVRAISIDALGNKWFGTYEGGVSKFDGTNWTGYNTGNSGIVNNFVNAISIDALGNLWFGTFGGVSKFNGTTWTTYTRSNSGLANNEVSAISSDALGNLWFETYDGGVSKFDGTTWATYTRSNSGLARNRINAISIDALGNLWFGTNGGGVSVLLNSSSSDNPVSKPTITGKVYLDKNQNQVVDNDEGYLKGQKVLLNPGNITAYTNANGEYRFQADSGVSYTVSYVPTGLYTLTKDTTYSVVTSNTNVQLPPFAVYAPDTVIYRSTISLPDRGRCNTEATSWFTYTNLGTTEHNTSVMVSLDPDLELINSFPTYDSIVGNSLYYTFNAFKAGSDRQIKLMVENPTFLRMGDTLVYSTTLSADDVTFTETAKSLVTCSYDPNDKAVSPLPIGEENYTLKNEILKYTIRFQNMGNDTAFYVAIIDTLHNALDLTTFEVLASSHSVHTTMNAEGVVTFEFANIILPDSATNEPESNGFVSYQIKAVTNVSDYTLVTNTAYIYFDQNPAIITNTTLNNLVTTIPTDIVGIENNIENTKVLFYPNPLTGSSVLKLKDNTSSKATLMVQDISGKTVVSKTSSNQEFVLYKSEFNSNGLFIYTIQTEDDLISGKLMVE